MRTNIVLNDQLVQKAFFLAPKIKTKKDLIETALKEFISVRKSKNLQELRKMDLFDPDYDYRDLRN